MIDSHEEVFCIIDALDERSKGSRLKLIERLDTLGPKIRVLIMSRYLDNIGKDSDKYQRFEIRANKADITPFIEHQIRRDDNLRRIVDRSDSLRVDIKETVFERADGL